MNVQDGKMLSGRPITDVLRDHDKGAAVLQASEELAELVDAVINEAKAGSLTIKITVSPNKKSKDVIFLGVETKLSKPKSTAPLSIFFTDDNGGLHRRDPRQKEIFEAAPGGIPAGMAKA
jgi:hypothetical protein